MTEIHLLLYRLAELMLDYEQHILSVDLLFDDEQIGDYVKSIQIDSPYQQMLFEGVLTESVKDEKLLVSFTVEGYFHHVLGEVIYNRTEGLSADSLKQIVEENKLNGAKEGAEHCLIRDVQKNELERLIWLIDEGGKALEIIAYPLAQAFLMLPIERVLNELLSEPTENDIVAIEKTIQKLEDTQKNEAVRIIYIMINKLILPNSFKSLSILIESIEYIDYEKGLNLLMTLKNTINKLKNKEEEQSIHQEIGIQFLNKEDYANAEIHLKKSIQLEREINKKEGNENSILGRSQSYLCSVWIAKKLYEKAIRYYKKELNILLKNEENEEHNLYLVYNNLGYLYSCKYDELSPKKPDFLNSEKNYNLSLSIRLKIFGKHHPSTAIVFNNLGLLYDRFDIDKSEEFHKKSLDIRFSIFANKSPTDISYNNLSNLYYKKGDINSAIIYGEKALSIRIKEFGIYNSKTGTSYNNLALYYCELKKYNKSLGYVLNAIKIRKKIFGFFDIDVASSYILLSTIYSEQSKYKEAIIYETKALKIRLNQLGSNATKTGYSYYNLGFLHSNNGDIKKAITNYKKALKIEIFNQGIDHTETGSTFFTLANLFLEIKDYRKAKDYFKKGFVSNPDSGGFPYRIGICCESLKQQKEAIEYYCLSAGLRKISFGIEDDATQKAIKDAVRLAIDSDNLKLLPNWMKEISNDE